MTTRNSRAVAQRVATTKTEATEISMRSPGK